MTKETHLQEAPPSAVLRQAFSLFPTGVVAVCAMHESQPVGMAVNSFFSLSLEPPLVGISVARTSATWPALNGCERIGLSILGSEQGAVCRRLASRGVDRFEGTPWQGSDTGAVFVEGAALWLECRVHAVQDGGDHEIVSLEVVDMKVFDDVTPLVFHQSQFRGLEMSNGVARNG